MKFIKLFIITTFITSFTFSQEKYSVNYLDSILEVEIKHSPKNLKEVSKSLKSYQNKTLLTYQLFARWSYCNHDFLSKEVYKKSKNLNTRLSYIYSLMLDSLSKYSGLESTIIKGEIKFIYSKRDYYRTIYWNEILIEGKKYCTSLLEENYLNFDKLYLLQDPNLFYLAHIPKKRKLGKTYNISHKRFSKWPEYREGYYKINSCYNHNLLDFKSTVKTDSIVFKFNPFSSDLSIKNISYEYADGKNIYLDDFEFTQKDQFFEYILDLSRIPYKIKNKKNRIRIILEYLDNKANEEQSIEIIVFHLKKNKNRKNV